MAALHFLLNGEPRTVSDVSPTMTVLDWLRTDARLTGTKEGCAEGDCGACTIAVGRRQNGTITYEAVNSCLMVVPQLDGSAVMTVEGVSGPDGALHAVQQAMVDADATQCGFCTPGFVMALFAFQNGGEPAEDHVIHDALAGNLCRCTGYRSIVDAAKRATASKMSAPAQTAANALDALSPCHELRVGDQLFLAPPTLAALTEAVAQHPDAKVLAGGTDLGLRVSKDREVWPVVISTAAVPELREITESGDAVTFGGAVTYTQALPYLDKHFPSFAALVRRIGSRQIRNLGTLAGNLANASPIGDSIPCLMALDAQVTLRSSSGTRTVPADDFITAYRKTTLAPGEVIASIRVPLLKPGQQFVAYKLSKRFDQDISTVVAAYRLAVVDGKLAELRAVYGGMAARTMHAANVEAAVRGKPWIPDALADADALIARDFQPMTDQRGGAAYRLRAAANLLRRLQLETTTADIPTRVEAL